MCGISSYESNGEFNHGSSSSLWYISFMTVVYGIDDPASPVLAPQPRIRSTSRLHALFFLYSTTHRMPSQTLGTFDISVECTLSAWCLWCFLKASFHECFPTLLSQDEICFSKSRVRGQSCGVNGTRPCKFTVCLGSRMENPTAVPTTTPEWRSNARSFASQISDCVSWMLVSRTISLCVGSRACMQLDGYRSVLSPNVS
jgi:hypothetical protein